MLLTFREAEMADLPAIVRMLADDLLGKDRERLEDPLPECYTKAFREIDADPNNELIVAELDRKVVGTFQLTFTPSISSQGGKRCTVESVRVDSAYRGKGIGHKMMRWAIERAQGKGCAVVQLGSHKDRTDAHRFYEKLGFSTTHVEMKLILK
jgi:GNAT superfamily N-acetyltransferase